MRYVYGMFRTRDEAEDFLIDMFATGSVCEPERPRIEKRGGSYAITLRCE